MKESISSKIRYFYEKISKLPDLSPGALVNSAFEELYSYTISKKDSSDFLVDERVLGLNKLCCLAECELEKYYAKQILSAEDARSELEKFPYYANYDQLVKLEYGALISQIQNPHSVLFAGSGSFPLTAILLAKRYGITACLVDVDQEAVQLSQQLIQKLWLEDLIQVVYSDICSYQDNVMYDSVFLAAHLFSGGASDKILSHVRQYLQAKTFLIRSTEGIRQLLYTQAPLQQIVDYFTPQLIVHPKNELINSLVLCTIFN